MVPEGITRVVDEGEISLPYQYKGDVPPLRLWMLMLPPEGATGETVDNRKDQSVRLNPILPADLEPHV